MDKKIILRIKIDGRNWNDLISLPCVKEVTKGDEDLIKDKTKQIPHVQLYDSYLPQKFLMETGDLRFDTIAQRMKAKNGWIGDDLVEYNDGTWEVVGRKEASNA